MRSLLLLHPNSNNGPGLSVTSPRQLQLSGVTREWFLPFKNTRTWIKEKVSFPSQGDHTSRFERDSLLCVPWIPAGTLKCPVFDAIKLSALVAAATFECIVLIQGRIIYLILNQGLKVIYSSQKLCLETAANCMHNFKKFSGLHPGSPAAGDGLGGERRGSVPFWHQIFWSPCPESHFRIYEHAHKKLLLKFRAVFSKRHH